MFFSSDNGPWYQGSTGPLRGRKGWTFDGGVPSARSRSLRPGNIRSGKVSDEPVATLDFFATAMALAGEKDAAVAWKQPLDGKNILQFLLGREPTDRNTSISSLTGAVLRNPPRRPLEDPRRALEYSAIHGGFRTAEEPPVAEAGIV